MNFDLFSSDSETGQISFRQSLGEGISFKAPQSERWTAASTRRIKSEARVCPSLLDNAAILRSEKKAKHELETIRKIVRGLHIKRRIPDETYHPDHESLIKGEEGSGQRGD